MRLPQIMIHVQFSCIESRIFEYNRIILVIGSRTRG
jgi:hypothetical protein